MIELLASALVSFAAPASAQQEAPRSWLQPVTGPLREVRVRVDPATGHATRVPPSPELGGPVPVYDNTCAWYGVTYFFNGLKPAHVSGGTRAEALITAGRLPSTASAETATCTPGSADTYAITQLEIRYCTSTGAPVTYATHFWNNAGGACPDVFALPTDFDLTLHGLPRAPAAGVVACYAVTIDVGRPGFTLIGGAANTTSQRFAYSMEYPGTTGNDGPIVAGNPKFGGCAPCAGTIWERPVQTQNPGTGLGSVGAWWQESFGGTSTGCFFFGSHADYYLRLRADVSAPSLGQPFCDASDGAHGLCPCGASRAASGCDHAQGYGVHAALVARDVAQQTATIQGSLYPSGRPTALLIRGNTREPAPIPFGDGLRCVGLAGLVRLAATTASGALSVHAFSHGAGSGTFHYQIWYRNTPATFCTPDAFNLSNGQSLTW